MIPIPNGVRVWIATGHTDKATIDRAFEVGATDFVSKPLDWSLLQHRVRFLLRAHDAFAELSESEQRRANAQRLARIGDWEWVLDERGMLWSAQVHEILGVPQGPDAASLAAYLGATGSLHVVWDVADTLNGLMALPNLVALLILSPVVARSLREFAKREAAAAGRSR